MRLRRRTGEPSFDGAEAARVTMYDELTGLAGRYLFFDRLGLALARTERRQSWAAVLLLDIDGFQEITQQAGPETADDTLREVADRLMTVIRPGDSVARVGDAQFAVLCEEIEGEDAAVGIAQRLEAALAFPFELAQVSVHLSASVGIALAGGRDADAEALIRGAATAMRTAREHGGARYEVFHQSPPPATGASGG
jgi:diguanylate cyclase (GGDEF)-like protein